MILLLRSVSPACFFWLSPCAQAPQECSVNHVVLPVVCACTSKLLAGTVPLTLKPPPVISTPGSCRGVVNTDLMEALAVLLLNSAHLVYQQYHLAFPGQRDNFSGSYSSSLPRNLHSAHADCRIKMAWLRTRDTATKIAEGRCLQKRSQSADGPSKMTFLQPDSSNVIIPTNYFHDLI